MNDFSFESQLQNRQLRMTALKVIESLLYINHMIHAPIPFRINLVSKLHKIVCDSTKNIAVKEWSLLQTKTYIVVENKT